MAVDSMSEYGLARRRAVVMSAGAGVLAALVMGAVLMIVSAARGLGFFTPVELIGATFVGADWSTSPAAAFALGMATHLAIGAGLGALFGEMVSDVDPLGSRLAAGVAFGAATFLVMTFLVLPWANPIMYYSVDKGLFFLAHLVFGATLPLALARRVRRVAARPFGHPRRA
jgi:hypothetical protein